MAEDKANPKDALGSLKVDLALNPPAGAIEQARAQGDGARKYGAYNWRLHAVKGMVYISAAQRHLSAYLDGEDYSRDSTYVVRNSDPDTWLQVQNVLVPVYGIDGTITSHDVSNATPESLGVAAGFYVKGGGYLKAADVTVVQNPVHHLGHVMACCAIMLDARAAAKLLDNRPTPGAASDLFDSYTLQKPKDVEPFVPNGFADLKGFDAEGSDATWLEEVKRKQASNAVDLLQQLTDEWWEATAREQAALAPRIKACKDLILNMVNGLFPIAPESYCMDEGCPHYGTDHVHSQPNSNVVAFPTDEGGGP